MVAKPGKIYGFIINREEEWTIYCNEVINGPELFFSNNGVMNFIRNNMYYTPKETL